MRFTNSPLVSYTRISPNRTRNRNHAIDTITIHCVVGQCSVQSIGAVFASPSRQASSNYGIGYDGKVGMYVEEKDRSWCSSSPSNDHRAITIEVASDTYHPYAVTSAAYATLLTLVTDICKRNGIKKLLWRGDPKLIGQITKQNMTVHRWFANKACPGDYLYNRHSQIAAEVNRRLGAIDPPKPPVTHDFEKGDIVEIIGDTYSSGGTIPSWVKAKHWVVESVKDDVVIINKDVDGEYAIMSPVYNYDLKLIKAVNPIPPSDDIKVGDIVNFNGDTHYTSSNATSGSACKPGVAKVTVIAKDGKHPYHLVRQAGGASTVYGWVNAEDVEKKGEPVKPYIIRVTTDTLNVRKKPTTSSEIVNHIKRNGVYTIVDEANGDGASKWGLLKAYAKNRDGWISLDYIEKA